MTNLISACIFLKKKKIPKRLYECNHLHMYKPFLQVEAVRYTRCKILPHLNSLIVNIYCIFMNLQMIKIEIKSFSKLHSFSILKFI